MAIVPENRRLFGADDACSRTSRWARTCRRRRREGGLRARLLRSSRCCYERRGQLAGTLSGGEQQMVAMGRALMARPKLLLMDEPSMGLAPILVERSFEIIKQVHESGVAMLVVEQNANVSLSIADRGYVLSTGRVVLEGPAKDLLAARGLCGRPTLAVEAAHARGSKCRHRFPIFEQQRLRQLVLAGRAVGRGARRLRAVPRGLGRVRRARGSTGWSAPKPHAPRSREARSTPAPDEIAVTTSLSAGVRRARERSPLRRPRVTRSCSPTGSSRRSARSGTRRRRAARASCTSRGRRRRDDPAPSTSDARSTSRRR